MPPNAEPDNGPETMKNELEEANQAFVDGDYARAFQITTRLCQSDPNSRTFQFLRGETAFAAGQMADAVAAYDEVIRLEPSLEPQLWQRGLALYYADRFQDGVSQFETHQTVNSQDVENAVWHLLCAARISDVEQARKNLIPIEYDRRVPMAQIYELYAGRMKQEDVMKAANQLSERVQQDSRMHKLQLYYAYLYIGLFEEMMGNNEAAIEAMTKAAEINPLPKDNFMGNVSTVHLKLRSGSEESGSSEGNQ